MTTGREVAGEKSTVSTEITLQWIIVQIFKPTTLYYTLHTWLFLKNVHVLHFQVLQFHVLHFHVLHFHVRHFHVLQFHVLSFGPSFSRPAISCPAHWSFNFMSCNFMPCKLVHQFHVRHFHVQHFQRPLFDHRVCDACTVHRESKRISHCFCHKIIKYWPIVKLLLTTHLDVQGALQTDKPKAVRVTRVKLVCWQKMDWHIYSAERNGTRTALTWIVKKS